MIAEELLVHLAQNGVKLWTDGGQLQVRAPKGALTPALRKSLNDHKQAILEILEEQRTTTSSSSGSIPSVDRNRPYPLSVAQQRLWLLYQLDPQSSMYNISVSLQMKGPLNLSALEWGLNEVVRRHNTFRTTFTVMNSQPLQCISPYNPFSLSVVNLENLDQDQRQEKIHQVKQAAAQEPFNLTTGPVWRAKLIKISSQDHIFLLTLHHIMADGWSMELVYDELSLLYQSFIKSEPPHLLPLPIQYVDFSEWQHERLKRQAFSSQVNYWKKQLKDTPPILDLPTDFPRPSKLSGNGTVQPIDIPRSLSHALRHLAQQEGVTLFMVLLAALNVFLYRYSGQQDLVIGTPIANRNHPAIKKLVGFFVNMLVLRADLSGNPSFLELLERVKKCALDAYRNQEVPFEKLVEEINPTRSLSHSPLFQISLGLRNFRKKHLHFPDLEIISQRLDSQGSKFDLAFLLEEKEDGTLEGIVEYSTDLFTRPTIQRLLNHFRTLLQHVVDNPKVPIPQIPILEEPEREHLLVDLNNTKTDYPRETPIIALFEEQVARAPHSLALVAGSCQLTYAVLHAHANQLARYLQRRGVVSGDRVGVCLARGVDLIVSLLAILKAGGAYVPLDPNIPRERLAYLIEDAAIEVIVTQDHFRTIVEGGEGVPVLALDRDWNSIIKEPRRSFEVPATSAALAYIMYTSGSTGQPKGTLISQKSVVRLVNSTNYVRLDAAQRILQLAPFAFDASTFEIWGSLLNGGRLVVMPPGPVDLDEVGRRVDEEQINLVWLTAGLFHQMVEQQSTRLSQVPQVLAGGDVLFPGSVREVLAHGSGGCVINGYGPTENTTFACCHPMTDESLPEETVPIGTPIANTQVYVLDRFAQLVPRGVSGELVLGGDGLAWGYLNRPGLTAEKFLPHPYSTEPGARVYRTGDQVRWNQQGALEFQGRRDNQIKLRGYRIELGEIEVTLSGHPGIQDAVVLCREDVPGTKELVAYVVWKPDKEDVAELREYLTQRLPGYMVPSAFVNLEQLPLGTNGKINRQVLPPPDRMRAHGGPSYVAPRTSLEEMVTAIWQEILDIKQVGIHDNFFEIGGHSLIATRLVQQLQVILGIEIPFTKPFEAPTIEQFCTVLEKDSSISSNLEQRAKLFLRVKTLS